MTPGAIASAKKERPCPDFPGRGILGEQGLENEARAELDFTLGKVRGECQRCSAGRNCGWRDESLRMHRPGIIRADDIVDACIVGAVGQVKRFGHELNIVVISEVNVSAKP